LRPIESDHDGIFSQMQNRSPSFKYQNGSYLWAITNSCFKHCMMIKHMKKQHFYSVFIMSFCLQYTHAQHWQHLFSKKDLTGWHTIPGGKWEVVDGVLIGTSEKSEPRHGLLVTDKSYSDFIISVTYKAIKGNSGLYFRAEEVGDIVGVKGFQAEIDPTQDAGGLYETMGRGWVIKPKPKDVKTWYKPNEWNEMTVEARGGTIIVKVNGKESARLINDSGRAAGKIALQLHGDMDMEVLFREVKIKVFKAM